ncbi:hypothetical protein [Streptacidiphilus carbonis]|uniref:hypothetical protein n=1 Tax=Streptacidiphilus carbonis TaxID=105422 RepID=UPI0005AB72AD|nr:hypothetical protein [Streptacidiphilus carbonis]
MTTTYELRAEHRPAEVGRRVRRWHIAHTHRLKGWCGRLLDPVSDVRPITHAPVVEQALRCPDCWRLFAAGRAFPPWSAGNRAS